MHFRLPAILLGFAALAAAQLSPQFDAVSIRPSTAADTSNRLGPTPQGGLRGQNVTILQLIAMGYAVRPFQIVDAPGWASTERFDVTATPDVPEERPSRDRFRERLRAMLADRFGLVIESTSRPVPVYKLQLAKDGPKIQASKPGDSLHMESNERMLRGTAADLKTIADSLSGILLRPIVDETGLTGTFNFDLQFADLRLDDASNETTAPALFTAITQQLGLKLESGRAAAPVLVVQNVHRPSEN